MNERPRRALSNVGGVVAHRGEPRIARDLVDALKAAEVPPSDELTHGIHSYPGRMHWALARTLVERFTPKRGAVLDPFCGSGTVLVESRRMGCPSIGVDLNSLALRIAEAKTACTSESGRRRFLDEIDAVVEGSLERVRSRTPIRAQLHPSEASYYDPHVIKELAGLLAEIALVEHAPRRRMMEVVFSSIVVKFSRQRADTSSRLVEKRIRKGLVTEFFGRKAHELVLCWAEFSAVARKPCADVRFVQGDARELSKLLRAPTEIGLTLTSPPYGGTYDYVAHHARRYPWLGLDAREFERRELGSRRRLSRTKGASSTWTAEVQAMLASIAAVAAVGSTVLLVLGDAEVEGRRIDASTQVERLCSEAALRVRAVASQERADFRGGGPRREHVVCLERVR